MNKRTFSKEVKEKYDRIIDGFSVLEVDRITVMTGSNGSGKSMIRKQLPFAMQDRLKLDTPEEGQRMVVSTSMDARTGSNVNLGALSNIMNDIDWIATSQNTFHSICGLFDSIAKGDGIKYVVVDEFEIGCSEETILALVLFINERVKELLDKKKIIGAMIITHSRLGVKNLVHDDFINLDGLTKEEWLNRKVIPTDLEKLKENELFHYIKTQK